MSFHGGALGVILAIFFYARLNKISIFSPKKINFFSEINENFLKIFVFFQKLKKSPKIKKSKLLELIVNII